MTATSRQRPSRSVTATTRATVPVAVPSTLWAAGTEALDPSDRWPEPILSRAVREFSAPGYRVLLIGWPPPASRGELRVIEPDTAAAMAAVAALGRHSEDNPAPRTGASEPVDLVVVSLLADHLDPVAAAEQVAALAVERMAAGGLLVVLGRCRHSRSGVLIDPAGAVVAAAQAADLLYLQHIIAVPVTGTTITATPPADAPDSGADRHPVAHAVAHTDVFAFLLPRSTEPLPPQ
ncbi:hypothetical protein [Nocardia pneumoniae]|uniref:hypothetical protein n=1 Tax=Nocardia pneumoniae TaxID=228601 RepID=UPI00030630DA|nr:hypothetical protein [Nocardia pneumoniae]